MQKGRFYSRHPNKHQVRFVAHRPQEGVQGTDLTFDVVEFPEDTDGMAMACDVFKPATPVYLLDDKSTIEAYDVEQDDKEYTMMDPNKVMWTSTAYEDEASEGSEQEQE